VERERESTRK